MIPLLAITAFSGTGKTTLLKQLITIMKAQGIRPGLIKHAHHNMDIDIPGKDSYELRKAGADQVMVFNQQRWALMTETPQQQPDLQFLTSRMDLSSLDIILLEGFKHEPVAKIALWREGEREQALDQLLDEHVIAVASDRKISVNYPLLDLNNPQQIAGFIAQWLQEQIM